MTFFDSKTLNAANIMFIFGGLSTGFGFYNKSLITGIAGIFFILISFILFYKYGKINNRIINYS